MHQQDCSSAERGKRARLPPWWCLIVASLLVGACGQEEPFGPTVPLNKYERLSFCNSLFLAVGNMALFAAVARDKSLQTAEDMMSYEPIPGFNDAKRAMGEKAAAAAREGHEFRNPMEEAKRIATELDFDNDGAYSDREARVMFKITKECMKASKE